MKKLTAFITCIFLTLTGFSQSCLPEGITFSTQAQMDSFQVNYPGCTEIIGDVTISGSNISNLNGLSVLTFIGGTLNISWNPVLTSLDALGNLTHIGGSLVIHNNSALTSLAGLENVDAGPLDDMVIYDNSGLITCDLDFICTYLGNPNGHVDIYGNAEGCSNPPDIADQCGIMLSCLPYGDYYFTKQSEIDNFPEDYSNCSNLEGIVKINGSDITNLYGLNGITSIGFYLTILQNDALVSLEGLEGLTTINGAFSIGYNTSLINLVGLNNVTSIGGYLSIYNNGSLVNLSGLNNLASLGDMLEIMNNENLASLEALQNLTSAGGFIRITYNPSLSSLAGLDNIEPGTIGMLIIVFNSSCATCEVHSICDYLAVPSAFAQINDNTVGCNTRQEVEAACESIHVGEFPGNKNFSISPNPCSIGITINISGFHQQGILSIINLNGRELLRQFVTDPAIVIDISHLPAGVYFVRMEEEKTVRVEKFIKLD